MFPPTAPEVWEEFLDRVATGDHSIKAICAQPGMPGRRTVYDRIDHDVEFAGRLRACKALGVHAIIDDCLTIADEEVTTELQVKNKRVRIDTRLRVAGKWLPDVYADRLNNVRDTDESPIVIQGGLPDAPPSIVAPDSDPK